jgi:hypothetical protein
VGSGIIFKSFILSLLLSLSSDVEKVDPLFEDATVDIVERESASGTQLTGVVGRNGIGVMYWSCGVGLQGSRL